MAKFRFQYKLKRLIVRWQKWRKKLDNKLILDKNKLTDFEQKAIRLWRLCLKDKDTQLAYNSFGIRQLEKGNLFLIFKPSGNNDFIMTIMDINDERKNVFEIHIPTRNAYDVCDYFDMELEKRTREAEVAKRSIIIDDLDRLIEIEEKELNRKRK
jgi:hypothetical protein